MFPESQSHDRPALISSVVISKMVRSAFLVAIVVIVLTYSECTASAIAGGDTDTKDSFEHRCVCSAGQCSCCRNVTLRDFQKKHQICSKFQYDKTKQSFATKIEIDGKTEIDENVSANSTKPVCKEIKFEENTTNVCFHFLNVNVSSNTVSGCVRFNILVQKKKQTVNLGCFKFSVAMTLNTPQNKKLLQHRKLVKIWKRKMLVRFFHITFEETLVI